MNLAIAALSLIPFGSAPRKSPLAIDLANEPVYRAQVLRMLDVIAKPKWEAITVDSILNEGQGKIVAFVFFDNEDHVLLRVEVRTLCFSGVVLVKAKDHNVRKAYPGIKFMLAIADTWAVRCGRPKGYPVALDVDIRSDETLEIRAIPLT